MTNGPDMAELDGLIRELVDVQDRLLELPADAFAERYPLQQRRDQLRAAVARYQEEQDSGRSRVELERELAALRDQLAAIRGQHIDAVVQAGGAAGSTGQMGNLGVTELNIRMDRAQGTDAILARIGQIEDRLAKLE